MAAAAQGRIRVPSLAYRLRRALAAVVVGWQGRCLAVLTREVRYAAGGWLSCECGVAAVVIV
ncbi:hypothetical protein, partial [Mycobacteroides abscessus]